MPVQENEFGAEPAAAATGAEPAAAANVAALNRAVDDGALWIDGLLVADGVHERCADAYECLADRIEAQVAVLRTATELPGFGGFASGAALQTGFEHKADGALTRLLEYATTARELAQILRTAAAAYHQADQRLASAVDQIGGSGSIHA
ncbi:hypothetical protein [Nocardia sp. CNY236]|uniref:hypothetical protein n=1 Tax=Nocardia sp. CNY236 TaxID=1169152 RepID=UPI001E439E91|nr:hypothetical protein [Nocardia sp. CNY236]